MGISILDTEFVAVLLDLIIFVDAYSHCICVNTRQNVDSRILDALFLMHGEQQARSNVTPASFTNRAYTTVLINLYVRI